MEIAAFGRFLLWMALLVRLQEHQVWNYKSLHLSFSSSPFPYKTFSIHEMMKKTTGNGGYKDGPLSEALFDNPRDILIDRDDNLIVSDCNYIRMINFHTQQVKTIGGDGQYVIRYKNNEREEDSILFWDDILHTLIHTFSSFYKKGMESDWILHFNPLIKWWWIQMDSSILWTTTLSEE